MTNLKFQKSESEICNLRSEIVKLIGTPYDKPWKCWQFVRHVYSLAGGELPESIYDASKFFAPCSLLPAPCFLDLLYFHFPVHQRHVAIALDAHTVIHCSQSTNGVAVTLLYRLPPPKDIYRLRSREHGAWSREPECA